MSSEVHHLPASVTQSVKIIVLGPFGVGKTTLINSVSEIRPLSTEETMTQYGQAVDDLADLPDKTTTTVAMDFGRLTIGDDIALYLFGAPGQPRFRTFVDDLMLGALGGIVLADTRRIDASFDHIDRLENAGVPYVITVNSFDGAPEYSEEELRQAFQLDDDTPLVICDARRRETAKLPLISLVRHLLAHTDASAPRPEPSRT
ncbi:signal recognition particle receptor subunit beta [Phytomonospora endophytica]|uniref:Signal recognition particle receptor subunit beta n=2 Tax=Phytomonospora endophytica TaxID=714109 RepID=A0A841FXQ9_9ACTN|nr:signal recognition particle receptor subunit beta [Phytomonospora endophytica]